MINDAAKAGLEEKKQEVKRQLEDKARDLFKSLLGRYAQSLNKRNPP